MKRGFVLFLTICAITAMAACGGNAVESMANAGQPYIAVVSKGFQHQFWQTVYAGSKAAAEDYGVFITFEGPPSESDTQKQADMVMAALDKKPVALCLAALDTQSLNEPLLAAQKAGIPVIGFDSDVPEAPEGSIYAMAATDNYAAGVLAAEKMWEEPSIQARVAAATLTSPVTIAVFSQDAASASIFNRTKGFVDTIYERVYGVHQDAIRVIGHALFNRSSGASAAVVIQVMIPPTPAYSDGEATAKSLMHYSSNLIGVFCSNEGTVTGLLSATNDGTALDRENGAYKDLIVIGFDSGASQKQAVQQQYFYGSITQDPYRIGYLAVELACKIIQGESVDAVVDTGCKFYTHATIDDPEIAQLLYD